jgi:putative molybdopterin biosynthesis protein
MGGLLALQRDEAHIAPIHLLDPADGSYNTRFIAKYLPDRAITLVKGVRRIQGLMVRKGNPLQIRGIRDLPGKKYVNRPKSAGTRLLFDMLLTQERIDPRDIPGYTNEKFTHTAVAAAVKAGIADAGMGICSAAARMDLDFVPLCEEEYDFAIPDSFLDHPGVKAFLQVLESEEFRQRLDRMGGYVKP